MRNLIGLTSAIAIGMWAADAQAAVKVNFVNPDHYIDAGGYRGKDRARSLEEIERTFQKLADRYLAADQTLTIDVLDVDLAGRLEPWHFNSYDVRYMRDITWPTMKLRYELDGANAPPLRGEETLSDPGYLDFPGTHISGQTLPYEKAMLERWFRARLVDRRPPRS